MIKSTIPKRAFADTHDVVFQMIQSNSYHKILDAGAGPGAMAQKLHQQSYDVTALDIDKEQFIPKNIAFIESNLNSNLPLKDNIFDCIVCIETFEHLRNPGTCLQEFHRILKENGELYLTIPNITSLLSRFIFLFTGQFQNFLNKDLYFRYEKGDRHILPMPRWLLVHHLELSGFKVISTRYSRGGIEIKRRKRSLKLAFLPNCSLLGNTVIFKAIKKNK